MCCTFLQEKLICHPILYSLLGTNPDKHYITIYRSLAGVWLIFGLGWLAALLNLGTRLIKHVLGQTLAPFNVVNEDCPLAEKQEDGTAHHVIKL